MRLILIRHGDPDYARDSLTEKGKREAALLAERAKGWKVDDVYSSPFGRAYETALACCAVWKKEPRVVDWAQEWMGVIDDGKGGIRIAWDFFPSEWTDDERNFNAQKWLEIPRTSPLKKRYEEVCARLDETIASYGYERRRNAYRVRERSDKTVVIFCHFGISMLMLSHLLNLPAQALLHGLYLAPTSVTVLNTEERHADEAYFRAERIGDCLHLYRGGEPISESGYFAKVMQEVGKGE